MAVDDIKKLRPELLEKSEAELERLANEIALARAHKARAAEVAAKEELASEANRHIEAIVDGVKFLHDKGILPERIATAFSRGDGMFTPGMMLRAVTAESLLTSALTGGKPKRKRRSKAEMEAARAAGEPARRRR